MAQHDQAPARPDGGRGPAQAGYIMGIIGTILLGLGLLFGVLLVVIGIIGAASSSYS